MIKRLKYHNLFKKKIYDYNDARYMYIIYKDNTKKNSLKVMNVIKVVKMLVDKMLVKYLLNPKC